MYTVSVIKPDQVKYFLKYSAISVVFVIAGALFLLQDNKTAREEHEDFILESYKPLADLPDQQDAESKSPDQPDMAAYQEFLQTVDPELGYVPKERLLSAYEYTRSFGDLQKSTTEYEPPIEWEGTGANMGGRTRAIMFDPNDSGNKKVWAGGVTGGLWYNEDITNLEKE